jgi:hypothetical protein
MMMMMLVASVHHIPGQYFPHQDIQYNRVVADSSYSTHLSSSSSSLSLLPLLWTCIVVVVVVHHHDDRDDDEKDD